MQKRNLGNTDIQLTSIGFGGAPGSGVSSATEEWTADAALSTVTVS